MESESSPMADEPETPAVPPDPSTVVDRLMSNPDWPEPSLIEDVIALGEAAVGPLLDRMRGALDHPDERSEGILYYGIGILGELRTPEAIPTLVELIRHNLEDLGEVAAEAVGGFGPVAFDPILELIQSGVLTGYPRTRAIHAAKMAAGEDSDLRAQLGDVLKPVLAQLIETVRAQVAGRPPEEEAEDEDIEEDEERFLDKEVDQELLRQERYESQPVEAVALPDLDEREQLTFLVTDLADLAHLPSRELIDKAFKEDLIDPFWVDKESVDEFYERGGEPVRRQDDWVEGYRRRREEHLEYEKQRKISGRKTFQSAVGPGFGRPPEKEPPPPPQETIRNVGPKLSRNDPCWCGSGKKYKKCHLGKDERG